jgi:SWI/SNF-related matrix-associated actin-dependent regulator 1 of chromatin subfamily A
MLGASNSSMTENCACCQQFWVFWEPLQVTACSLNSNHVLPRCTHSFSFIGARHRTELALAELNTMSDHAVHDVCSSIGTIRHLALPQQVLFESAKVQKLLQLLEELLPAGHRVLLFSQWTQILDVLQDALQAKSYLWCRLDGSSKVEDRQSIIDEFNTNTSIGVFLISTRAGGVGINLTSADTVIIHDVDFNPQIDKQAQDRCHRVGQTKPVTVYRLVAVGTVDESVFECAMRKETLANDALSGTNDGESAPDKKEETREILRAMMQACHFCD